MKLRIFSDMHIESPSVAGLAIGDEDVIVCAGDMANDAISGLMWLRSRFTESRIVFVPGNHEYYGASIAEREYDMLEFGKRAGIDVLINNCVEIGGFRFIGTTLWSNFQLYPERMAMSMRECEKWVNDFEYIKVNPNRKLSAAYVIAHLFAPALEFLKDELLASDYNKTVVVTHFAACTKSVAPRFVNDICTPYFVNSLDYLLPNAPLWIHGHTHTAFDYKLNSARVICNPGGYRREKTGFNPNLIVEI